MLQNYSLVLYEKLTEKDMVEYRIGISGKSKRQKPLHVDLRFNRILTHILRGLRSPTT